MEWLKKMYAKKLELLGSRRFWQLTLTAALEIVKNSNPEMIDVLTVIQAWLLGITAIGSWDKTWKK
jgi:hypothetical protein